MVRRQQLVMRNLEIHICNMKRLGIIAALDSEFAQVAALLSNVVKGEINGLPFIEGDFGSNLRIGLAKSGIGKVCATVGTVELIKSFKPDFLINTGVAGGIDASLNVMDVVVSTGKTFTLFIPAIMALLPASGIVPCLQFAGVQSVLGIPWSAFTAVLYTLPFLYVLLLESWRK